MKQAVSKHNTKLEKAGAELCQAQAPGCNCNGGVESCPLGGNCLIDKVVYKSTLVEEDNTVNTYTGLTSNTFKQRHYGHKSSFNHRGDTDNSTTLSTHVWKLKDHKKDFNIR